MKKANSDVCEEVLRIRLDLEQALRFSSESPNTDFLISSLTEHNPFYSTREIREWLDSLNKEEYFLVERIPLTDMRSWYFDRWSGDLCHDSGRYFSIRGLKVQTNIGPVKEWTQPIIHQPEIGILGILTKRIDGILYFLMQAKAEPGNINTFQLSPTVQATRSNYMRVHGGKPTLYLEYFLDTDSVTVLVDQLQSEQGARFFRKRNRNIIIRVPEDAEIEVHPNFHWLTLGQLKRLMRMDNTVNMDARSVLSSIAFVPETRNSIEPIDEEELLECVENSPLLSKPLDRIRIKTVVSEHENTTSTHDVDHILHQLSKYKFGCDLDAHLIPLNEVRDWRRTPDEIFHKETKFFRITGVRVSAANREVSSWDQPIIQQVDPGIIGFIMREINGVIHFLVQSKMESGNMDLLELAPTVQCITGSYQVGKRPPFVNDFLAPQGYEIIFDTMQSEEGGRFYHEENRNMLIFSDERFPETEPSHYLWMSMKHLKLFLKFNNFLNVESRSLISII